MTNPFAIIQMGVFASAPASRGTVSMPAQICASLARRIASPPAGYAALDKEWWSSAFNKLPFLSPAQTVNGSIADCTPATIAGLCLGVDVVNDAPGGRDALADWIAAIRPLPVSLNSMAVTGSGAAIHLSLAFIDTGAATFTRTDTVINAAVLTQRQYLQTVFESAQPLTTEPYHCSLGAG